MAAGRRTSDYRRRNISSMDRRQFYVYGSAVQQAEALPKRRPETHRRKAPQHVSRQVVRNRNRAMNINPAYADRNRAMNINPAYAVFLVAAAFCAVFLCVMYLRLQSEVVNHSENLTTLQEDLANLTEANNTAYNAAEDSVNLEEVRDKAMNEMGMVYESQGNVIEYESPASGYVKQYDSIPEDGVLAQSQDISN